MRKLPKSFRTRVAIFIALAYAFCVLAPSAALASAHSANSFHCLAELSGITALGEHEGISHVHGDGKVHHHDQSGAPDHHSDADGKFHGGGCCGLFSLSALAHNPGLTFGVSALASPTVSAAAHGLDGRAPAPLHRPPIA